MWPRYHVLRLAGAGLALLALMTFRAAVVTGAQSPGLPVPQAPRPQASAAADTPRPDFARMVRDQAETDRAWQLASEGYMRMEKITYRSSRGDLEIPAFVFRPLATRSSRRHPALVWVHEDIRGHLYEHHIPFIRDAVAQGYVVIAPEYRGSIGYGRTFYVAIDYGGGWDEEVQRESMWRPQYRC